MGIWTKSPSGEIASKHDLRSASTIHWAAVLRLRRNRHCSLASAVQRSGRPPEACGAAGVAAMGSSARRYQAGRARSGLVGRPRGRLLPLACGINSRRTGGARAPGCPNVSLAAAVFCGLSQRWHGLTVLALTWRCRHHCPAGFTPPCYHDRMLREGTAGGPAGFVFA
jgi:hypothetical protein